MLSNFTAVCLAFAFAGSKWGFPFRTDKRSQFKELGAILVRERRHTVVGGKTRNAFGIAAIAATRPALTLRPYSGCRWHLYRIPMEQRIQFPFIYFWRRFRKTAFLLFNDCQWQCQQCFLPSETFNKNGARHSRMGMKGGGDCWRIAKVLCQALMCSEIWNEPKISQNTEFQGYFLFCLGHVNWPNRQLLDTGVSNCVKTG